MVGLCSQLCRQLPIIFPCLAEQTVLTIFVVFMGMGFLRPPRYVLLSGMSIVSETGRRLLTVGHIVPVFYVVRRVQGILRFYL